MAISNAERQRLFRERHLDEGGKLVLHLIVDAKTMMQLKRLARWHATTVTAIVEELAAKADSDIRNELSDGERRAYARKLES
jgi:hypothetical protein